MGTYRLGTRNSALARYQTQWVREKLEGQGVSVEIVESESLGDKDLLTALYEMELESPGIFTKHLESQLVAGTIDLAVHSLKDLPTTQPAGLKVACIPVRETGGECLFIRKDVLDASRPLGLPTGATVGTSSLRREALFLSVRPDLNVVPIRGNIPTRLKAVVERKITALVLAGAGVSRLGLGHSEVECLMLPEDVFVCAPGQGALAVEVRSDDEGTKRLASRIDHHDSRLATTAERAFHASLGGGCQLPLGALATVKGEALRLEGVLLDPDGKKRIRLVTEGPKEKAQEIGAQLGKTLKKEGAEELLHVSR